MFLILLIYLLIPFHLFLLKLWSKIIEFYCLAVLIQNSLQTTRSLSQVLRFFFQKLKRLQLIMWINTHIRLMTQTQNYCVNIFIPIWKLFRLFRIYFFWHFVKFLNTCTLLRDLKIMNKYSSAGFPHPTFVVRETELYILK